MPKAINRLIPAEDALNIVLRGVEPVGAEEIKLSDAANRILHKDLQAMRTQPPFDASAMDGYAVRQEDITQLPSTLNLIGQSRAGEPFPGSVGPGEAVRIFTGAVVPNGADSVVIQENTQSNADTVTVEQGVEQGKFVRRAGLDFANGDTLLFVGDPMTSNRLSLAASMNHATITVYKKPVVALLSTGDELVMPGQATGPGQIIASNTFGLSASISGSGARLLDMGLIPDSLDALAESMQRAVELEPDLLVTTGGASVGDHDLVLPAAESLGFSFEIKKIAMRPGKPFLFGKMQRDNRTIYLTGLAGNPVSSLVAYNVFVKPLIQTLAGQTPDTITMQQAVLGIDLQENDERAEYMRAVTKISADGVLVVTPFERQDSSMLANLVRADCLLYRPVHAPAARKGDRCQIVPIE